MEKNLVLFTGKFTKRFVEKHSFSNMYIGTAHSIQIEHLAAACEKATSDLGLRGGFRRVLLASHD